MGRPQDEDDEEDLGALYDQTGNERDNPAQPGHNRGEDPEDALDDLALDDLMKEGRKMLMVDLIRAVQNGHATPAEKNTLRQMLKDNGMVMGDPNEGASPGGQADRPKADLPTFAKPGYEN